MYLELCLVILGSEIINMQGRNPFFRCLLCTLFLRRAIDLQQGERRASSLMSEEQKTYSRFTYSEVALEIIYATLDLTTTC